MIHGVLNVYKEKGYTSHDVVAKLRGIVGQKKIGHTGTLDPEAEGVLPVCLGKATRLCDMLTEKDKVYETVMLLGTVTDTQDTTGTVLEKKSVDGLAVQEAMDCIQEYIGEYQQMPPMYSALKVNGKKLCDLAREGKTVERKRRTVRIYDISVLETELPRVKMRVHCSKGTYIRTLCHDIGESLGVGGCMESLQRTRVERFDISESFTLSEIEERMKAGRIGEILIPVDHMFSDYPKVTLKKEAASCAYNGNALKREFFRENREWTGSERLRVYDDLGDFVGIYEYQPEIRRVKLIKMFYQK